MLVQSGLQESWWAEAVVQAVFSLVCLGTHDGTLYVAIQAVLFLFLSVRVGTHEGAMYVKYASGRTTAPCTWRSRLFFFCTLGVHDGAKNASVKAVFVRLRTHDGAKYVRSSFWLPLQSVWTPSKRASRCG